MNFKVLLSNFLSRRTSISNHVLLSEIEENEAKEEEREGSRNACLLVLLYLYLMDSGIFTLTNAIGKRGGGCNATLSTRAEYHQ